MNGKSGTTTISIAIIPHEDDAEGTNNDDNAILILRAMAMTLMLRNIDVEGNDKK